MRARIKLLIVIDCYADIRTNRCCRLSRELESRTAIIKLGFATNSQFETPNFG